MEKISSNNLENRPGSERVTHLEDKKDAIFVCLSNEKKLPISDNDLKTLLSGHSTDGIDNLNFEYPFRAPENTGFITGGRGTYVISEISERDKYSDGFYSCSSLIVCGTDEETGKNVSILTHQFPGAILEDACEDFWSDLEKQLSEIKKKCILGSIDSVLLGGDYLTRHHKKDYINQINHISDILNSALGFKPAIVGGPKLKNFGEGDIVFISTEKRRVYLIRKKEIGFYPSFETHEIEKQKKQWDSDHMKLNKEELE